MLPYSERCSPRCLGTVKRDMMMVRSLAVGPVVVEHACAAGAEYSTMHLPSPLYRQPNCITATEAECRDPFMHIAPNHLVEQGRQNTRAGGPDRVA